MWLPLPLALNFLLVAAKGRHMASEVDITQLAVADCRPPHLAVGGQCLLVDTDTSEGCTSPFLPVGDQCLNFATFAKLTQIEAQQLCHSMHSQLATVDTATRHKNIINYINNNGLAGESYWVDGSDQVTEGDWLYSSGQPVPMGTPFWASRIGEREPNNSGDESCLQLYVTTHYYLNDIECADTFAPLCEQPRQTNSTALRPQPRTDCPIMYVGVGSLCLSFVIWADETWTEAKQACHGMSGELAAVTDIQDLRAIYRYLHEEGIAGHSFWLGGSDAATEGVWTWTDGATIPSGAPFWGMASSSSNIEPDGGSDENCLLLDAEGFHYFRDASCGLLMNPLCQPVE